MSNVSTFEKPSGESWHHISHTFLFSGGPAVRARDSKRADSCATADQFIWDGPMSMVTASIFPRVEEDRYLALLQAANAIATCDDCTKASEALVRKLREVTPFDFLHLVAFDKDTNQVCFTLLEANG